MKFWVEIRDVTVYLAWQDTNGVATTTYSRSLMGFALEEDRNKFADDVASGLGGLEVKKDV